MGPPGGPKLRPPGGPKLGPRFVEMDRLAVQNRDRKLEPDSNQNGAVATTFSDAVGYKTEAENGHKTVKIFGTKSTPDSGAVDMTFIDVGELNKGIPSLILGDTQDPTSGTRGLHKGAPRKKSIGRVLSIVRS